MNVAVSLLEYLKKYDNAELKGLGGFKVKYTSAFHSFVNNTITPPARELMFSEDTSGDLSFVRYMADTEFISEETANTWISQFANGVVEKLNSFGTYRLGDLGVLNKDNEGRISFIPNTGLNLLEDGFAFTTLKDVKTFDKDGYIEPIRTREEIVEEEIIEELEETAQEPLIEQEEIISLKVKQPVDTPMIDLKDDDEEDLDEDDIETIDEEDSEERIFEEESKSLDIEFEESQDEIEERDEEEREESVSTHQDIEIESVEEQDEKISEYVSNIQKKKKVKVVGRKQKVWKRIFMIVFILIILMLGVLFAHYMCWLQGIEKLEPLNNKLEKIIGPKCKSDVEHVEDITPADLPEDNILLDEAEDDYELEDIEEAIEEEVEEPVVQTPKSAAKPAPKRSAKPKISGERDVPPTPTAEIDYTTPILIQEMSRRGFDVIGGTFSQRSNAEQTAREARSMGYDSYILQREKDGKPIYYVSYGSRDTYGAANNFMKQISNKTGSKDFYIISR